MNSMFCCARDKKHEADRRASGRGGVPSSSQPAPEGLRPGPAWAAPPVAATPAPMPRSALRPMLEAATPLPQAVLGIVLDYLPKHAGWAHCADWLRAFDPLRWPTGREVGVAIARLADAGDETLAPLAREVRQAAAGAARRRPLEALCLVLAAQAPEGLAERAVAAGALAEQVALMQVRRVAVALIDFAPWSPAAPPALVESKMAPLSDLAVTLRLLHDHAAPSEPRWTIADERWIRGRVAALDLAADGSPRALLNRVAQRTLALVEALGEADLERLWQSLERARLQAFGRETTYLERDLMLQ